MAQFGATPYRPTGLATADRTLASGVHLLEWCTGLVSDALDGHLDLGQTAQADRDLRGVTAGLRVPDVIVPACAGPFAQGVTQPWKHSPPPRRSDVML